MNYSTAKNTCSGERKVSVIFVNYNGITLLGCLFMDFLESLRKQEYDDFEILMIDNASLDDSCIIAKKIIPNIKIVKNMRNIGYANAVNIGLHFSNGDIVVVLNNDIILPSNFIKELLKEIELCRKEFKTKDIVLVPLQVVEDKTKILGSFPVVNWLGQALHIDYRMNIKEFKEKVYPILPERWLASYPDGAAFAICKSTAYKLRNMVLTPFPQMYFDDVELGIRLMMIGARTCFTKNITIYHRLSATSISVSLLNKHIGYYVNRLTVFTALLGHWKAIIVAPLLMIFDLSTLLLMAIHIKANIFTIIMNCFKYLKSCITMYKSISTLKSYYRLISTNKVRLEDIFSNYIFIPKWLYKEHSIVLKLGLIFIAMIHKVLYKSKKAGIKIIKVDTIL